jgi:hypothetical protein
MMILKSGTRLYKCFFIGHVQARNSDVFLTRRWHRYSFSQEYLAYLKRRWMKI